LKKILIVIIITINYYIIYSFFLNKIV